MAEWGGGCPVTVWDGPYSYRCSLGGDGGACAYHGRFADDPRRTIGTSPVGADALTRAQDVANRTAEADLTSRAEEQR